MNNNQEKSDSLINRNNKSIVQLFLDIKLIPLYFIGLTGVIFAFYHLERVNYAPTAIRYWLALLFGLICFLMPIIGAIIWIVSTRFGAIRDGKITVVHSKKRVLSNKTGDIWVLEGQAAIYLFDKTIMKSVYISGHWVKDLDVGANIRFLVYPQKNPWTVVPLDQISSVKTSSGVSRR